MSLRSFVVLVSRVVTSVVGHAQERSAVDVLFAKPEQGDLRQSPSGKNLAIEVRDEKGRMNLAVADAEQPKKLRVLVADEKLDVGQVRWVNDDWLVFQLVDQQAGGGAQDYQPGLIGIRRDGSGMRVLLNPTFGVNPETGTNIKSQVLDWRHRFMTTLDNGSTDVVVGEYRFDGKHEVESIHPKLVDVANGRARPAVLGEPPFATRWFFDAAGEARAARSWRAGMYEVFWRESSGGWKSIGRFPAIERPWSPMDVDVDGNLYVQVGTTQLSPFDFAARKPGPVVVSTPGFDIDSAKLVEEAGKVVGVRVTTDAETTAWFDPARKKLQEIADARFPGHVNRMVCKKCDGAGAMVVFSFSDRDPGTWWVYRPKTAEWTPIGSIRPKVDPRRMATLDLHRIKARDGLELPVWVTTPAGKSPGSRPAVMLVHGGPWLRGTQWEWNPEAQFLASRGYVVIEPEFRGSAGYGFDWFKAGWKQWGTGMQDDVADALRWAIDRGIVDPKRVCIAGGSYGGYATLMGAIRYPDLYRCGVAWAAVTDPRLLYEESWSNDSSQEVRQYLRPALMGDLVKDADLLKAATPVERAAEIRIPMLLAFGGSDRRVPIEHGHRIRDAMRASGQQPEYVVYQDEGHGWFSARNEIDFWTRVEKFLARHIGD
jgi:dipeptidyl aminopeptidase/acylaminoacyl peptidase